MKDKLVAGRELDALIAEKVMGWKHIGVDEPYRFHIDEGGVIVGGVPEVFNRGEIPERWMPSTSIADAWLVVEKMRERWRADDPESEYWQFVDCQEFGWRVDIMWQHHDGDVCMYWVAAETLPIAICLAALESVEGKP